MPDVSSKDKFGPDSYLTPVLENDALLYVMEEYFDENSNLSETARLQLRIEELEDDLKNATLRMNEYREVSRKLIEQQMPDADESREGGAKNAEEASKQIESTAEAGVAQTKSVDEKQDEEYFDSYSWTGKCHYILS